MEFDEHATFEQGIKDIFKCLVLAQFGAKVWWCFVQILEFFEARTNAMPITTRKSMVAEKRRYLLVSDRGVNYRSILSILPNSEPE